MDLDWFTSSWKGNTEELNLSPLRKNFLKKGWALFIYTPTCIYALLFIQYALLCMFYYTFYCLYSVIYCIYSKTTLHKTLFSIMNSKPVDLEGTQSQAGHTPLETWDAQSPGGGGWQHTRTEGRS